MQQRYKQMTARLSTLVSHLVRGKRLHIISAGMGSGIATAVILATALSVRADSQPATFYACVNLSSGTIHMTTANGTCDKNEQLISWNQVGPQGPQGPQGPAGPSGGVGFHGVKLYTSSASWTAPAGVMGVLVEAWGGGGAAGFEPHIVQNGGIPLYFCGGGGGGGAYVRGVAAVTPGQTYEIVVGAGGAGGTPAVSPTAGGASGLSSSGTLLVGADGGQPGTDGSGSDARNAGVGGAGGQGGNANGGLLYAGANGKNGTHSTNPSACDGDGGLVGFVGSVPAGLGLGTGGTSAPFLGHGSPPGGAGNGGGVLLTW